MNAGRDSRVAQYGVSAVSGEFCGRREGNSMPRGCAGAVVVPNSAVGQRRGGGQAAQ